MQFNSLAFIVFLMIVFALYWIIPQKHRWILLLVSSYYFYMSWSAKYVILIVFTTGISYITAILIENQRKKKKIILLIGSLICLSVLVCFKYFNFFSETITDILKYFSLTVNPITLKLFLPVGISFYTFQTLSYMIDVYRGTIHAEHHFGIFATYISFFPQLVAGPIERTENLLPQIKCPPEFKYDIAIAGLRLMLFGFFKKIAIADVVGRYTDMVYGDLRNYVGFELAIVAIFFTIQIYCDFSGYSDIAIGTAKLFGVELTTNFKSPYFSSSIKEFWSRWHISLSTWFRDYLYIPLGGSHCSKIRHRLNILITFMISGLWHGASWTFVLWGGIHGMLQVLEDCFRVPLEKFKRIRCGQWILIILVFICCNFAWVFFRVDTVSDAIYVITHMFNGITNLGEYVQNDIGLDRVKLLYIFIFIFVVAAIDFVNIKKDVIEIFARLPKGIRYIVEYLMTGAILYAAINSMGTNQFVYFQF